MCMQLSVSENHIEKLLTLVHNLHVYDGAVTFILGWKFLQL